MSNPGFTPALNIGALTRKSKGLHFNKQLGGISVPFYHTDDVVAEGQPMKYGSDLLEIAPVAQGDGALVSGLSLQATYELPTDGQFAQIAQYNFAGQTAQPLNGSPIGLMSGSGWAMLKNYKGEVAAGDQAYLSADGTQLTAAVPSGDDPAVGDPDTAKVPVIFEGAGTDGDTEVLIRFNFEVAPSLVAGS